MTPCFEARYEKRVFLWSALMALGLHLTLLVGLLVGGNLDREERFEPIATMNFAHFDPEGGEAGGADSDDLASGDGPEPAPQEAREEEAAAQPEATPAPVTEEIQEEIQEEIPKEEAEQPPEEELNEEKPDLIESVSEKADAIQPPPPKPKPKPKAVKPRPKKQPPKAARAAKAAKPSEAAGPGKGLKTQGGGGPGKGRGGIGGGKGQGNPNALNAYINQVVRRLQRYKKYPPSARSRNIQGRATVSFSIDRNGGLHSPRLVKSSGHKILDDEVMALLRRAAPMPPIPRELNRDRVSVTVPIIFSVK